MTLESDSEIDSETELESELFSARIESTFDKKDFYPNGSLNDIITRPKVEKHLLHQRLKEEYLQTEEVDSIIEFIARRDGAQKLFAIAVLSSIQGRLLLKVIKWFKKYDFSDTALPITDGNRNQILQLEAGNHQTRSPWTRKRASDFLENQWMFVVPVLSPINPDKFIDLSLEPKVILPFDLEGGGPKEGAFGTVYKIKVHPDHDSNLFRSDDGTPRSVAVKQMKHQQAANELEQRQIEIMWSAEVNALKDSQNINTEHIIEYFGAITRGSERYLMFPWANGGNLRDFWSGKKNRKPTLSLQLVKAMVTQLKGLVDALVEFHNFKDNSEAMETMGTPSGARYRHGDLKPENILRFLSSGEVEHEINIGTLRMADLGLAKYHPESTEFAQRSSEIHTTYRYQAPEVMTAKNKPRSRRYDIWSLGCIFLEFMIWLLYGSDQLEFFNRQLNSVYSRESPYFLLENGNSTAKVHPVVKAAMNIIDEDQECKGSTAMKDLLRLVRDRLLIVRVTTPTMNSQKPKLIDTGPVPIRLEDVDGKGSEGEDDAGGDPDRASADELHTELEGMLSKATKSQHYWFSGPDNNTLRPNVYSSRTVSNTTGQSTLAVRNNLPKVSSSPTQIVRTARTVTDHADVLDNKFSFQIDNWFAGEVARNLEACEIFNHPRSSSRLCGKCQNMDFFDPEFRRIEDSCSALERDSVSCEFCRMRWNHYKDSRAEGDWVRFNLKDNESTLSLYENYPPVLSICRGTASTGRRETSYQIGLPTLPVVGSEMYFELLSSWLRYCDENHPECQSPTNAPLPSRLIDVGSEQVPALRLYETKTGDSMKYIALSHPWGTGTHFCTFITNVRDFKQHIDFKSLPDTFKHAVLTARKLGIRYLWIDSICIIQGDDGDFETEAHRMEAVFSSAWCVLAASSAESQNDGFLLPRAERRSFVTIKRDDRPAIHVCDFIDDFNQDVLDGPLNKRGWVFQERALARRTIFFTRTQAYWECGRGIRSETLTRMDNKLASFLGDPNFPSKLAHDATSRGEKIRGYEDLYSQYSRLAFSRLTDRPIAIVGLEKRLIRDLKTLGGWGVFDDRRSYLQHSLLWCRGKDVKSLTRISNDNSLAPTWSWMAYCEGIEYLNLPPGDVKWFPDEVYSPWTSPPAASGLPVYETDDMALWARARSFLGIYTEAMLHPETQAVYDVPNMMGAALAGLRCIVMGREKANTKNDGNKAHYVLFIMPDETSSANGSLTYKRVGVGSMIGRLIDLDSILPFTKVR
ncbi:putative HET-domain-containing protein [Seiridium unicorne]|uniref:HET-domain-containing protein n=1 Tax=Seiridium unicorne TaxID=138068 RepID=A0ABR2UZ10_9PEZI